MRTALDTNILSKMLSGTPTASRISSALEEIRTDGTLLICAVVYAELLAHPKLSEESLNGFLVDTRIIVDYRMERDVWVEAGLRYARYAVRHRKATGEAPRRLLADFMIGAHARAYADRLMTFDLGVFGRDFPDLRLHSPLAD